MSTVHIPADKVELDGELILPPSAKGVVLFAHGSGSSRFSPRNTYVAEVLQQHGRRRLKWAMKLLRWYRAADAPIWPERLT